MHWGLDNTEQAQQFLEVQPLTTLDSEVIVYDKNVRKNSHGDEFWIQ